MRVKQLFADAYRCGPVLDNADILMEAMRESVTAVGANIVNSCKTNYQPHGVTNVLVLAESHCVVSTWPEHGYAAVDILLCNEDMDPMDVWRFLKEFLQPEDEHVQILMRHMFPPGVAAT